MNFGEVPDLYTRFLLESGTTEDITQELGQVMETVKVLGIRGIWEQFVKDFTAFLPKLLAALAFAVLALLLTWFAGKLVKRALGRSKVDKALHYFVTTVVKYALLAVGAVTCIGILGFPITPIITAFSAVGLAFSLAIKDSLSNLAGGVFMLFNCPFRTGDYIELKGIAGTVREIRLTYTILETNYNRSIFMPNGDFTKATITNYSMSETRCMELTFTVKPESGIQRAKDIILEVLTGSDIPLPEPMPAVRVSDQTDTAVKVTCTAWVEPSKLYDFKGYVIQRVRERFAEEGI